MAGANIGSVEVLKNFRQGYVKFDDECKQALASIHGDVARVAEWLKREQMQHWKRQFRRREELAQMAKLEYNRAIFGDKFHGKSSGVDERKRWEKALRMKEEAALKIEKVKRWGQVIEQQTSKLLRPCSALSSTLELTTPRVLGRLDHMLDSLDDYLRPGSSAPEGGS